MQKEASYLDWFDQPPNGQEPAKELSEWIGFESFSMHADDCSDAGYAGEFIKKKYNVNDKKALNIFIKAEKLYETMMKQMSKDEKIEYRIKCNKQLC